MQQVKLFKNVESELEDLEASINQWIQENDAKVISIQANIAPQTSTSTAGMNSFASSDILVVVMYEK